MSGFASYGAILDARDGDIRQLPARLRNADVRKVLVEALAAICVALNMDEETSVRVMGWVLPTQRLLTPAHSHGLAIDEHERDRFKAVLACIDSLLDGHLYAAITQPMCANCGGHLVEESVPGSVQFVIRCERLQRDDLRPRVAPSPRVAFNERTGQYLCSDGKRLQCRRAIALLAGVVL